MSAKRGTVLVAVVASLLVAPLVAATVLLRSQDWAPVHDMAGTELRVRDVGSAHTPLVGLPGRLGNTEQPGSHPGPLSFYVLAPVYRLLGGSGWALEASCAFSNAAAMLGCLVIARRRARTVGLLAAGIGLGLLALGYGPSLLTEPWNPNFPVLWFTVFLVAVWSVACGDVVMLPVVALTGSLCAQTHVPYVAVCGGIGAAAVIAAAYALRSSTRDPAPRARLLRWIGVSCTLLVLAWIPPVIDELRGKPGNLSVLFHYFATPPSEAIGIREAIPLVLSRLDIWFIAVEQLLRPEGLSRFMATPAPEPWRGGVALVVWTACAVVSARRQWSSLVALHAVVATSVVVAIFAISRIFGGPWPYLMYWVWSVGVLVLAACAMTFGSVALSRLGEARRLRVQAIATWAAVALVATCTVRSSMRAAEVRPAMGYRQGQQLRALMPATIRALREATGQAAGGTSRYLVTWSDALHGGAQGYGLLNELERAGFRAGVEAEHARLAGRHRVLAPEQATARVHLATGRWIEQARKDTSLVAVASADLRTAAERAESSKLRADIIELLSHTGRSDIVSLLDDDLVAASAQEPPLPPLQGLVLLRMEELGGPAAVFVIPIESR